MCALKGPGGRGKHNGVGETQAPRGHDRVLGERMSHNKRGVLVVTVRPCHKGHAIRLPDPDIGLDLPHPKRVSILENGTRIIENGTRISESFLRRVM